MISRQRKWDEYQTVPILEGVDWTNEEASLSAFNGLFQNAFGENIDPSEINMQLIKLFVWMTIENPSAARAFMIKLDPDVRSLQDIAERLGVTKQAVQRRVAAELGIGKRNYRDSDFLKLRGRELDVYKLVMCDGVSLGSAAMQIGISKTQVRNLVKKLEKMGYKYRKDIK